MSTELKHHRQ